MTVPALIATGMTRNVDTWNHLWTIGASGMTAAAEIVIRRLLGQRRRRFIKVLTRHFMTGCALEAHMVRDRFLIHNLAMAC